MAQSLDPRFVMVPPLQDIFFDKDLGIPLSAGIVTFYEDNDRTVLKPVYELSETPSNEYIYNELSNPLQLSSIGTFIDENGNDIVPYFFPYTGTPDDVPFSNIVDLYFITVYSSSGVFQFSRQAWPNIFPASTINTSSALTDNLLSNSVFSQVSFNAATLSPGYTFAVTGSNISTQIAPDWFVITSGSGTVTVQQIATLNTGIPSNPPYVLDILSTGLTTPLQLVQTLANDPRILQGQFANGSFVAGSEDGTTHNVTMSYVPSDGGANYELVDVVIPTNGFATYSGTLPIDGTPNPDPATTGFVNIIITIPQGAHIQITSIQLVAVSSGSDIVNYIEQTTQRQLDHLFHYYANELIIKPKDTILTGWDFALNPWQVYPTALTTITSACSYITDQTILWQATTSALNAGQASIANRQCLELQANSSTGNQFAIIQYIDPTSAMPYWSYIVSSLARMRIFTTNSTSVGVKMRLIYNASLPSTLSSTEPITSLSGSSITFSSSWTALTPLNDPTYILPNAYDIIESPNGDAFPDFNFDYFQLPVATAATMTLGIVLYTTGNITNSGTADSIVFDSISLVPNKFAVVSNPKTFDTVLKECQFYLEASYPLGTVPGTASAVDYIIKQQNIFPNSSLTAASLTPSNFSIDFKNYKRKAITAMSTGFFLPAGSSAGSLLGVLVNSNAVANSGTLPSTDWALASTGQKSINFVGNAGAQLLITSTIINPYCYIEFHYTIDARLGVNS
jgi:hypothetical protein